MTSVFFEPIGKGKYIVSPNLFYQDVKNNTNNYIKKCPCGQSYKPFDERGNTIATMCDTCTKEKKVYEEIKMVENRFKKTQMCRNLEKCKYRDKCNFAHTKEELVKIPCKYGKHCKNVKCDYGHMSEAN